jgi:hypothetical protein
MMGLGGIALTGVTQGFKKAAEKTRFEHNQEVLNEAKQALLMYAYNYPTIFGRGPGRLPCPDTDNNGRAEPLATCQNVEVVGRLPWDDPNLNFYDARDASGQRLWYAVSETFDYGPGTTINSESTGTISIFDQTGNLVYDGATNGVAAVILAPGSTINAQDRSIANGDNPSDTNVDTDLGIINPGNYLDSFNAFNNSNFTDGGIANVDGFILGPVYNNNTLVINDQIVVITTDEIVAMAEKATLESYRNALNLYSANTDPANTGLNRYPWLDPYESADGLSTYDAVAQPLVPPLQPIIGRLPSIFANYFAPTAVDSESINIELRMSLKVGGESHYFTIPTSAFNSVKFLANSGLNLSIASSPLSDSYFFWDGAVGTTDLNSPNDNNWEVCPDVSGTAVDCNRGLAGDFNPTEVGTVPLSVRSAIITFASINPIIFPNIAGPSEYWVASIPENLDTNNHVYAAGTYLNPSAYIPSFNYNQDAAFDGISFVGAGTVTLSYVVDDFLKVGLPYYPVLPRWALDNDWHNNILMAYSAAVRPGGDGTCSAGVDDCLTLLNSGGVTNNKLALLIIAGEDNDGDADNGLVDGIGATNYFSDDLGDIFEGLNTTSPITGALVDQLTFEKPINGSGNDVILVLE